MADRFVGVNVAIELVAQGVCVALDRVGYIVESCADAHEWARSRAARGQHSVVVTSLDAADDVRSLRRTCAFDQIAVVAILMSPTIGSYMRALETGVTGLVAWTASADDLVDAVRAGFAGRTVLPAQLLRSLVVERERWTIASEDQDLMRAIVAGVSATTIAQSLNCSEREVYRRLRALWGRLGVTSRGEAIALARDLGLVEERPKAPSGKTALAFWLAADANSSGP